MTAHILGRLGGSQLDSIFEVLLDMVPGNFHRSYASLAGWPFVPILSASMASRFMVGCCCVVRTRRR
jgi:hypothetical protein